MNKLSIIVPVFHNELTLKELYEDLKLKVLDKLDEYEIIFVDDGSEDSSWEIIKEIKKQNSNVVAIKLTRNFGEHSAILAGLSNCSGNCAVTKQADMQEDSEIILDMYESWKKGNKVVIAARLSREDSFSTKLFANLYYEIIRKFVAKQMPQGGFDCYLLDRQAINTILSLNELNSSLSLQVLWSGYKNDIIYFKRKGRTKGKGRWTFAKKIKLMMDSILSFSYLPIRLMWIVGILFFIFSIIMAISIIIEYFTKGVSVKGWTSLMCVILGSSGLTMWMLGVIGEYIWRAFDNSRNRPPYIIDEIK